MNNDIRIHGRKEDGTHVTAFLHGYGAAEEDLENNTITDCPYQTPLAKRKWWKGYHQAERATVTNRHQYL